MFRRLVISLVVSCFFWELATAIAQPGRDDAVLSAAGRARAQQNQAIIDEDIVRLGRAVTSMQDQLKGLRAKGEALKALEKKQQQIVRRLEERKKKASRKLASEGDENLRILNALLDEINAATETLQSRLAQHERALVALNQRKQELSELIGRGKSR